MISRSKNVFRLLYSGSVATEPSLKSKASHDPDCADMAMEKGHFIKMAEDGSYDVYIYTDDGEHVADICYSIVWEKLVEDMENERY